MINVAIVSGGYTDESVISFKSSNLVYDHLNQKKYLPFHVRILKDDWFAEIEGEKFPIDKGNFSFKKDGKTVSFHVVYNTIHGTPGEDGILQAYWDTIGIKYTGCGFYESALTFNKRDCIAVLNKYGIPHAKSVYLNENESYQTKNILETVGLPCFVKPNRAGSSLGISKAKNKEELIPAIEKAFKADSEILIESFLDGTEVSVGVIEHNNDVKVLGITEIVSMNDFFDYEAKYEGKSEEITPARIPEQEKDAVENVAKKVFKTLNLKGLTRAEYIIVNGIPHFIEVNTLPGLSPESILPQQAMKAGISLEELFDHEIQKTLNL